MDQVPCGSVLVTKKLAKNGKAYLELSRGRVKVCIFQKEWENFKNSQDIIDIGLKYELSREKFLKPDNGQVCLYVANGFKFSLSSDDYYQILNNSVFIDDVKPLDEPNVYYTWRLEDGRGTYDVNSSEYYRDREVCVRDGELRALVGQKVIIDRHILNIESPAYLVYHIYLYMLEREIVKLAQGSCTGCVNGDMTDYRAHVNTGCMADWETKIVMNLDAAKARVTEPIIIDVFQRMCERCRLPTHPHMNNLVHMLCKYGHVTGEVLNDYKCPEQLLQFVIQSVYEEDTTK